MAGNRASKDAPKTRRAKAKNGKPKSYEAKAKTSTSKPSTVRDVCDCYSVGEHTVLGWIRSGELRAVNVARSPDSKKPRWRITTESLAAFELRRTTNPPPPPTRRRRQQHPEINYY